MSIHIREKAPQGVCDDVPDGLAADPGVRTQGLRQRARNLDGHGNPGFDRLGRPVHGQRLLNVAVGLPLRYAETLR